MRTHRQQLQKMLNSKSRRADKMWAQSGQLTHHNASTFDPETGNTTYSDTVTPVLVRAWPLSIRERIDLSSAGLTEIDTRYTMRCSQVSSDPIPGDLLRINGFQFEVLPGGVTKDEHDVEYILLTRRRET